MSSTLRQMLQLVGRAVEVAHYPKAGGIRSLTWAGRFTAAGGDCCCLNMPREGDQVNLPRVTIFYEDTPQPDQAGFEEMYPSGIGAVLQEQLRQKGCETKLALVSQPENGLGDGLLDETDVLVCWLHKADHLLDPAMMERIRQRVLGGMGLICLHSAIITTMFTPLMGTNCRFDFRMANERERVWVIDPAHPIAHGLPRSFDLEGEEMYGEPSDLPTPDELVFISWFEGGEVFRSGCCWRRGNGRIFFFRPGHETAPTFHRPVVHQVIFNAINWAAPLSSVTRGRGFARVDAPERGLSSRFSTPA